MSKIKFAETMVVPTRSDLTLESDVGDLQAAEGQAERIAQIVRLLDEARKKPKRKNEAADREESIDTYFCRVAAMYGLQCSTTKSKNKLTLDDLYDALVNGFCDILVSPAASCRPILMAIEIKPRLKSGSTAIPYQLTSQNHVQEMCYLEAVRRTLEDVPGVPAGVPCGVLSSLEFFAFFKSVGKYAYEISNIVDDKIMIAKYLDRLFFKCQLANEHIPSDHPSRENKSPLKGEIWGMCCFHSIFTFSLRSHSTSEDDVDDLSEDGAPLADIQEEGADAADEEEGADGEEANEEANDAGSPTATRGYLTLADRTPEENQELLAAAAVQSLRRFCSTSNRFEVSVSTTEG
jgi:hypothetical protein